MKILRHVTVGILVLLILIVGALGALLGTASGLRFLLEQADDAIPGQLAIAVIEGSLFGRLHLKQVTYRDEVMEVGVDEVMLRWFPGALLQGRFHLAQLSVISPRYVQLLTTEAPPEQAESGGKPLVLPDLTLPIEIQLDEVEIQGLTYRSAPDAKPVEVTRLLLTAGWDARGIALDTLELAMPGIGLTTKGTAEPRGNYAMDLLTQFSLSLPDLPKFQAAGHISGNLEDLSIEQNLSGDIQATFSASASDALGELGWIADLELAAFRLRSVVPDTDGDVAGQLSARGDLQQAHAEGQMRLEHADAFYAPWHADLKLAADLEALAVAIDRLVLTRPETPLELTLTGTADADLNVDIRGRWDSLKWPPSGAARFGSESGSLELKGTAEDYRLTLAARVAGSDIPPGEWKIAGRGSQEKFEIEKLEGRTLQGKLVADGTLAWVPAVTWDATVKAAGINPGVQYPEWPGKLDLVFTSKGVIQDGKPDVTAVIDTLKGTLRERPLDGAGTIKVVGEEFTIDAVTLASGAATVNANGRLGQQSDLTWEIEIADLADLLPDATGAVRGKGKVRGALTEPSINGNLSADGVHYQDIMVETLEADVALDLSDQTPSRIAVQSQNIQVDNERIASLVVKANGRKKDHRLEANVEHTLAKVALNLGGAYDEAASTWKGSLTELDLLSTDLGNWGLKQPVAIVVAPEDLKLDEICLVREAGFLCAQAALRNKKGTARLDAEGLQLSWLQGFLPPEVERLTGALGLRANATLDEIPRVDAELSIEPGEVVVQPPGEDAIALQHQGGLIRAALDKERLAIDLDLAIGDDGLKGRVKVPRGPLDQDPLSAPLDGDINLRFRQLQLFAGLIPAIQELRGEVLVNLKLGGRLGNPTVKGEAGLTIPQLQIPDAGLALRDIALKARSDDGKLIRLDGSIASGKGQLALDGDIELDPDKNWPVQVSLKGKDFQVLNLPDMTSRIATDLTFNHTAAGMMLQGRVNIPHAYIVLDDLPEGTVSPSSDVVVVTGEQVVPPDKGAPFAMQVTVALGKDVQFRGFGLKAYLDGKLTVIQAPGEFPKGSGEVRIKEGTYKAYGQDLVIDRGIVTFFGGRIDNPGLNIRAARAADVDLGNGMVNVTAGVDVTGTAKRPNVTVFSNPAMEQKDAISILLTGNTSRNLGKGTGSLGMDADVNKNLSVGARYDPSTSTPGIVTKYRFNRKFHVEGTTSSEGSAADLFYSLEFD